MVFTLSAVPLLQQRHPLGVLIPAATDDAVQVYAACYVTINTTVSLPQFRLDSGIDFAVGHFNSSGTLYSAQANGFLISQQLINSSRWQNVKRPL